MRFDKQSTKQNVSETKKYKLMTNNIKKLDKKKWKGIFYLWY